MRKFQQIHDPFPLKIYRTFLALSCTLLFSTLLPAQHAHQQQKRVPLKQAFGINAFEWDFENEKDPSKIDEERLQGIKAFTAIRHYMDWEKLEHQEGSYSFNPTISGGWNYDALYTRCKAENIEVLACLKTIPKWLQQTYPEKERDNENVPLRYGKDFNDPRSYIEQAKVAFQFAARYGRNQKIDTSLLHVYNKPRWPNDKVNEVKQGLGLIRYIECDNERDKWWKGPKAYQSPEQYAANLSAFYDGHQNTMGAGVGVKNADPAMQVVMAGLAKPDASYVSKMIDWCRKNRGYLKDGRVDLCWDVINYHLYADDDNSSQGNKSTRGMSPENSAADSIAATFMKVARGQAGDMPVWMSETGYDVDQRSPLKAVPIGDKSALQTQADWILRSALLYMRAGISRVFFYQTYDENIGSGGRFASSGLLNKDHSPKPAGDYLYQLNRLMGEYAYQKTLSRTPFVDLYEFKGKQAYAMVKPSENGSHVDYVLNLSKAKQIRIYVPAAGKPEMAMNILKVLNGKVQLKVTETPIFVFPEY